MRRIIVSSVACPAVNTFSIFLKKDMIFEEEKKSTLKMRFDFPNKYCPKHFSF
jgi:hypothetical protein